MKNEFDYLNDVKIDFSQYEITDLTEKERIKMKKANRKRISRGKILALAACIAAVAAFSQTALATDLFGRIVKTVTTGHNSFVQTDMTGVSAPIPKEYRGYLFDENGNEATNYTDGAIYYDRSGNKIEDLEDYLSENVPELKAAKEKQNDDPLEESKKNGYPIIKDINEIDSYLCFKSALPEYLPEGYSFYGATAYGDQYLFVYYKNDKTGKYIMVDERILNEETAFSTGTDGKIKETSINGHKAVILDGRSIDWEQNGISIGIAFCHSKISQKDELLKIAKSVVQ